VSGCVFNCKGVEMNQYSNEELILKVDNDPKATEMERELADRLQEFLDREKQLGVSNGRN